MKAIMHFALTHMWVNACMWICRECITCQVETKSIWFINLPYDKIINYCHAFKLSPHPRPLVTRSVSFYRWAGRLFLFCDSCLLSAVFRPCGNLTRSIFCQHIFTLLCVYLNLANEFKTIIAHWCVWSVLGGGLGVYLLLFSPCWQVEGPRARAPKREGERERDPHFIGPGPNDVNMTATPWHMAQQAQEVRSRFALTVSVPHIQHTHEAPTTGNQAMPAMPTPLTTPNATPFVKQANGNSNNSNIANCSNTNYTCNNDGSNNNHVSSKLQRWKLHCHSEEKATAGHYTDFFQSKQSQMSVSPSLPSLGSPHW